MDEIFVVDFRQIFHRTYCSIFEYQTNTDMAANNANHLKIFKKSYKFTFRNFQNYICSRIFLKYTLFSF